MALARFELYEQRMKRVASVVLRLYIALALGCSSSEMIQLSSEPASD